MKFLGVILTIFIAVSVQAQTEIAKELKAVYPYHQ